MSTVRPSDGQSRAFKVAIVKSCDHLIARYSKQSSLFNFIQRPEAEAIKRRKRYGHVPRFVKHITSVVQD
ncbi:uncharacterized protein PITG_05710 [Phytophthora infestans T30-4]|uniref:Uncharacterized protein n=1 Tax=Phytophthora infestans (strain T30-4) TaxID=403677 RepID=D0N5I0_PHYIT|nr:uncharacterized protein PITG_05710 [Phytophthora infestans T30-4]EEY70321.1 conserved hypothetical protein [Phytophthora infestans T30-4]|eukprot:XP_002997975.1 conserved hypothetical protein [Phytophthora infestans T30-4]